ncbi:hypothetical protein [Bradyrhizobium sp.]|uniref:hypothetical protein n=1 Tax=Bradyrhizobium sp. TaxID=376 RepID=UPI00262BB090|nr:hypothetical protein [Bradyrhizobium sp.]
MNSTSSMSLEKEPAGAFNKAQRLIEQKAIYTLFAILQAVRGLRQNPPLQCNKQHGGGAPNSRRRHEQIQMITIVMGTAAPKAPPIINANADSRFASAGPSFPDMPLPHRAPAPRAGWIFMVNKGLTESEKGRIWLRKMPDFGP